MLLISFRSKTRGARVAEMKRLVFEIGGLHLDREMIHAKTVMKFRPQLPQQVRLRNAMRVNYVRTQRLASGRDGPNV